MKKQLVLRIMNRQKEWSGISALKDVLQIYLGRRVSGNEMKRLMRELREDGSVILQYKRVNGRMSGTEYVLNKNKNKWYKFLKIFSIIFLLSFIPVGTSSLDFERDPFSDCQKVDLRKAEIESSEFSLELMKEYFEILDVPNSEIAIKQSLLETGFFTSNVFENNNNLFGMKHPRVRPTESKGSKNGHAVYEHWTDSVRDYVLWYEYITRNKGYDNYFEFLVRVGYAEDKYYINKLLTINMI